MKTVIDFTLRTSENDYARAGGYETHEDALRACRQANEAPPSWAERDRPRYWVAQRIITLIETVGEPPPPPPETWKPTGELRWHGWKSGSSNQPELKLQQQWASDRDGRLEWRVVETVRVSPFEEGVRDA